MWLPRAPPEGRAYTPHHRRHLHKAHLTFRGPWPRASPRATKPGRGSTRTVTVTVNAAHLIGMILTHMVMECNWSLRWYSHATTRNLRPHVPSRVMHRAARWHWTPRQGGTGDRSASQSPIVNAVNHRKRNAASCERNRYSTYRSSNCTILFTCHKLAMICSSLQ